MDIPLTVELLSPKCKLEEEAFTLMPTKISLQEIVSLEIVSMEQEISNHRWMHYL